MGKEKLTRLKIKYIFPKDYNPVFVNGAYGGLSPRGDIVVNFFLERPALPNSQTYEINDGKIGTEIIEERDPTDLQGSIVRYISQGIILDYKNAKELQRWLGSHIEQLENADINQDTSKTKNSKK
jgi:hypothetical protein